jgi:N-acyl-L-homoserine lactone synthetase
MELFGPAPEEITLKHLHDFLEIRKKEFVDSLHWSVPHTERREWDQYDLPDALFVVAYEEGHCAGGLRLIPTTAERVEFWGIDRSWMLIDFARKNMMQGSMSLEQLSRLENAQTWEMTRFVSRSPRVTRALLERSNTFLSSRGAQSVLTLSPVFMSRVLRSAGYAAETLSEPMEFDGKKYVVLSTKVNSKYT